LGQAGGAAFGLDVGDVGGQARCLQAEHSGGGEGAGFVVFNVGRAEERQARRGER
jgi:hypothetical protein